MTRPCRLRQVLADDRGLAEPVSVMALAVVVMAFVMLLTLAGRGAEIRNRVDHVAESAAQAAARQRNADQAGNAATTVATSALDDACSGGPTVDVDTSNWGPGQAVTVTIHCRIPTGDLAPLPLPGTLTMTGRAAAIIDTARTP